MGGGITKENVSTLFQDHVSGYAKDADLSSMLIHIPEFEGPDEKAIENFIDYCKQIRQNKEVMECYKGTFIKYVTQLGISIWVIWG